MIKLEFEVTRKRSRRPICECDQSQPQIGLRMRGHVRERSHLLYDKACFNETCLSQKSISHFQRTGNVDNVALQYLRFMQLLISPDFVKTTGLKGPGNYVK